MNRTSFTPALALFALLLPACARPPSPSAEPETTQHLSVDEAVPHAGAIPTVSVPVAVDTTGLRVEGPHTHANLQVFTIHGRGTEPPRPILTLSDALAQKKVRVHETGEVQELAIENLTDDTDVYVQSGDIVQGGKQDRVLATDLLLTARSGKVPLASFCVESGRWSARGAAKTDVFDLSSYAAASNALKQAVRDTKNQQEVWEEVAKTQKALNDRLGVDVRAIGALSTGMSTSLPLSLDNEKVKTAAGAYSKALTGALGDRDDVLGYAFVINGKLNSAELYASAGLCRQMWDKMLHASAVEAVSLLDSAPKDAAAALPAADVLESLRERGATGEARDLHRRTRQVTLTQAHRVLTESRDPADIARWIHRSYLFR